MRQQEEVHCEIDRDEKLAENQRQLLPAVLLVKNAELPS